MSLYRENLRKATARAEFARGLALDAHPKSRWVFEDPSFTDHAPDLRPERLDHIAAEVVGDGGHAALDYWIRQAALASSQSEREEALSIARSISTKAGLEWLEDWEDAA